MNIDTLKEEILEQLGRNASKITDAQLEAYAGQVLILREAQQRVQTEGIIVPAIQIERTAQEEIRKWATIFKPAP